MAFIRLHKDGEEILVNTDNISYIKKNGYKSKIYFNFSKENGYENIKCVRLTVSETLDEIEELIRNADNPPTTRLQKL